MVVARGHDEEAIVALFTRRQLYGPSTPGLGARPLYSGVECDERAQPKMVHISIEISRDLLVVRVIGGVRRHREIGVLHLAAIAVDVERAVGSRPGAAKGPVAPDHAAKLETVEVDGGVFQRLHSGDAGGAGAHDTNSAHEWARLMNGRCS